MLKLIERLGPVEESAASDTLTLPFELRIRGRLKTKSDSGRELGLFLDRGPVLRSGEGLSEYWLTPGATGLSSGQSPRTAGAG